MVKQLMILIAKFFFERKLDFWFFIFLDEVPKGAFKVVLQESGKVKNLKFRLFWFKMLNPAETLELTLDQSVQAQAPWKKITF